MSLEEDLRSRLTAAIKAKDLRTAFGAGQMAMAWLVTIPAAGALAAAFYLLTDALGPEIAGPVAVSVLAAGAAAWLYFHTQRSGAIRSGDV